MADSAGDLADVRLKIHSNNLRIDLTKSGDAEECYVYLGEVLKYEVIVKKPKDYEYKGWRKRVSQLSAHACLSPLDPKLKQRKLETKTSLKNAPKIIPKICDETKEHTTFSPVIATYIDTVENPLIDVTSQSEKPYFKDSSTYVMPMSICVRDTPGQCHLAELNVILWLCISPLKTNPEVEAKKDFQLTTTADATNRKFVQQVSVSRTLHVHDPPQLNVRFVATGQQHLLLAEVKNRTRNTVTLKNLTIIPSPTPYFDHSKLVRDSSITEGPKSEWWNHVVCPAVSSGVMFPVTLRGCEELALVYRLDLSSVLSETELSFRTHLKWTHSETNREINTVYRLPKIRVRYPAFTVTVKCDGPVEARKTFYLTYNIANNLQDFLSVRLYWNLDSQLSLLQDRDDEEALAEKQTLEEVKRAVICHDPDIFIGSCPRGCTMPVNVGFQILQPGLYEMKSLCGAFWSYPDWLPQFQLVRS
ncbi:uncharacterized protein C7orf43 homolog isoform X3 [Pomacea canaliculata]|uniref:uncharacterized protein C7orf43 homolog isoform X3 n=1 Tax=Pomacea canaliculata TaxID=400727 RepID=UPI000D72AA6B|nr:uncharacterized protein C7orf43 homolog isoform X3 [Pomacea canaliculata]